MGYTASQIRQIDKTRYEDSFDSQGATTVIKRMTSTPTRERKPKNPTKQTTISWTAPFAIKQGTKVTINLANAGYSNLYDCSTWDDYYLADNVKYDYMGYYASASAPESETKTFLAQSGSTATQNFAFDGMDDLEIETE